MHRRRAGIRPAVSLAALAAITVCSAAMAPTGSAVASTAVTSGVATAAWSGGTVISAASGPFGEMLIVGSGRYKGFSLYAITSDRIGHYGCGSAVIRVLRRRLACTGPSDDGAAEWPAITTKGSPVAGRGVDARLLGSVYRKHVGRQVTYAGHPLYLFDNLPGQVTGEGWDEPDLPPWHGVWWVMSPSGQYQPWAESLVTARIGSRTVLAARMLTGIGYQDFPVYTYSNDGLTSSACTGACARQWPPLLTSGQPAVGKGVYSSYVSSIIRADGSRQVTYDGQPLYLYGFERIVHTRRGYVATGNGNGKQRGGGTFSLTRP
jgi:predicted lipoprotein with Yx(FWY)xxD motif